MGSFPCGGIPKLSGGKGVKDKWEPGNYLYQPCCNTGSAPGPGPTPIILLAPIKVSRLARLKLAFVESRLFIFTIPEQWMNSELPIYIPT